LQGAIKKDNSLLVMHPKVKTVPWSIAAWLPEIFVQMSLAASPLAEWVRTPKSLPPQSCCQEFSRKTVAELTTEAEDNAKK